MDTLEHATKHCRARLLTRINRVILNHSASRMPEMAKNIRDAVWEEFNLWIEAPNPRKRKSTKK